MCWKYPRTKEEYVRYRKSIEHIREFYMKIYEETRKEGIDVPLEELLPSHAQIIMYVKPDSKYSSKATV